MLFTKRRERDGERERGREGGGLYRWKVQAKVYVSVLHIPTLGL